MSAKVLRVMRKPVLPANPSELAWRIGHNQRASLVIQAGDEFIKARNESMDDHMTLIHAFPGSGMNRQALSTKLQSVQERLNNWMDLMDQYFVKCVPQRYMAQGPFDVGAINDQGTVVGTYIPYLLDSIPPNRAVTDLGWMEPFPTAHLTADAAAGRCTTRWTSWICWAQPPGMRFQ